MAIPTLNHKRHCSTCDRVIPPHRGANHCVQCEASIGTSCPWQVIAPADWSDAAWELEMARRGTYMRDVLERRAADVKGVAA